MRKQISIATICFGMLIAFLVPRTVHGQQDPMYSQYMFNTLAINPAYAGSADVLTVMALSRHQWTGLDGAPSTQTLVMHSPLKQEYLGVGFSMIHDKIGPVKQTGFYADVAYRMKVSDKGKLALGLKLGANLFTADLASLNTVEDDPTNVNIKGELHPNAGFGIYWSTKRYYVGASVPKLIKNEIGEPNNTSGLVGNEEMHFYLIGGGIIDVMDDLKFKPSVMAKMVSGAPLSIDVTANFLLREKIWFGVMYRIKDSFGLLAQYQINEQFRAGYAFDLTTSKLGAYNNGTHELMLSYDLKFTKGKTISPRYF